MSLDHLPRVPLARTPTPFHEAARLRESLGGEARCPRIFFKRDDLTDLALGGNKARKLEFLLGDAREAGVTALVTTGGPQSNHARMTAAAAALCRMKCTLVLGGPGPRERVGNLVLDRLVGADIRFTDGALEGDAAAAAEREAIDQAVRDHEEAGEVVRVIPLGGSDALGTLGYVVATRETIQQADAAGVRPARLYHASGSRGTQAGLELGARLFGAPWRVTGIAVSGGEEEKRRHAESLIREAAARIGENVSVAGSELITDQRWYGAGYAIPTAEAGEAIALVARTEGVFLDPVYTGKAMAGMIGHIRAGEIDADETVVFLHTGGVPALFAMAAG